MNQQIRDLFSKAEGRYFDDREGAELEAYAEGLLVRAESMRAIERAERLILDDAVRAVMNKYGAIPRDHGPEAELRVRRDLTLVLRYAAFAMLLHDQSFIYDKLAVWLRTIMYALCRPEQVLHGYKALAEACRTHLTSDDAAALVPYLQVLINEFESGGQLPS